MTLSATNFLVKQYLKTRQKRIHKFSYEPHKCQTHVFEKLITNQSNTEWGIKYRYQFIQNPTAYKNQVPVNAYEDLYPWISRMINGEKNILHPTEIKVFAKSSGTSNNRSKYIPLSQVMLSEGHDTASWDLLSMIYHLRQDTKIFINKNLIMAGSIHQFPNNPKAIYGDISAITLNNLPPFSRPYYTPDFDTALLHDWEEKLKKMINICSEEQVAMIAGVPSWTLILFQKMVAHKKVSTMEDIWSEASIYIHGGVGFEPYRNSFNKLFPSGNLDYMEVFNASEGFFAFQNDLNKDDLLLLLDHGIYYEFIPTEEFGKEKPETITLEEVEQDKVYALVISTLSGLSRYRLGDTVKFTSLDPYKIKVVGREQHYINAFGEELMVHNAESAIAKTADKMGVSIINYTVAPKYMENGASGRHEWLIEFDNRPDNIILFEKHLDYYLQELNSDYQAKRTNNLVMENLLVTSLPKGTFQSWMRRKGKLGGQNKVPRLSNDRSIVEEILLLINEVNV